MHHREAVSEDMDAGQVAAIKDIASTYTLEKRQPH
jgi:hypothetical protein